MLVLHEDLRRPALAAIRFDDPELVTAVHQGAVNYYHGRDEAWAAAEYVYHMLMAGEPADTLTHKLNEDVLQSLARSQSDLPPEAAKILSMSRSNLTNQLLKDAEARTKRDQR